MNNENNENNENNNTKKDNDKNDLKKAIHDNKLGTWNEANDDRNKLKLTKKKKKNLNKGISDLYAKAHYLHYFQFNARITPQLFLLLADRPLALKVLAIILYCAWPKRWGAVLIKQTDLRRAVAKSPDKLANRTSVSRAIHYLKSLGILAVSKYDVRNVYIINPKFIWQKPPTEKYLKRSVLNCPHIKFETNPENVRVLPKLRSKFEALHRPMVFPLSSSDFKYLTLRPGDKERTVIRHDQNDNPIKDSKGRLETITIKPKFISYYNKVFQRDYRIKSQKKRKARHQYYEEHHI